MTRPGLGRRRPRGTGSRASQSRFLYGWLGLSLLALTALSCCLPIAATARAGGRVRAVRYRGLSMLVPASWQVFDLRRHPSECVRFDRHAVYLGRPSAAQRCPARAVGRTEAILVEPLAARGANSAARAGRALAPVASQQAQPPRGSSTQLAIAASGVIVTATWSSHPEIVERALGRTSIATGRGGAAPGARASVPPARAAASGAGRVYTGLGFDACAAPSAARMAAWGSSPYRAVGVYIGGANMACAQPNLTAEWVSAQSAAGWHLIPTYVGLQAPHNSCRCAAISPGRASVEGAAAASDAVSQAAAVGIGPGNPIYFDMESYARGGANTSAVLTFLAAWTSRLHAAAYKSGVYSSAGSGISDLRSQYGTSFTEPDDVWIGEWNGRRSTTSAYVPSGDWSNHRRVHQYDGGHTETHGGVRISIDGNFLDGDTAGAGSPGASATIPDGTFVQVAGSQAIYEIAGGAPLYMSPQYWETLGAPPPVAITPQEFASLNQVPSDGTFLETATGAVYRVAGGAPLPISNRSLFANAQPVRIDPWEIADTGSPEAHLNVQPLDGTVVEGLPSASYWEVFGGRRRFTFPSATAVQVDDLGLAAIPAIPCVVPQLKRLTLRQVKHALRRADCRLGEAHIRRPAGGRRRRVVTQTPPPRTTHAAAYAVDVALR